jgi:hypothetical protein
VNSAKDARTALATLLGSVTTLQAVYPALKADFGGLSPICMLSTDGTRPAETTVLAGYEREHAILVGLWWARHATVEDDMDDLSEDVWDVLTGNTGPTADWGGLTIDEQFSQRDWPIVDGVQYRLEVIRVLIW